MQLQVVCVYEQVSWFHNTGIQVQLVCVCVCEHVSQCHDTGIKLQNLQCSAVVWAYLCHGGLGYSVVFLFVLFLFVSFLFFSLSLFVYYYLWFLYELQWAENIGMRNSKASRWNLKNRLQASVISRRSKLWRKGFLFSALWWQSSKEFGGERERERAEGGETQNYAWEDVVAVVEGELWMLWSDVNSFIYRYNAFWVST